MNKLILSYLTLQSMSTCLAVDHRHELVAIGTSEGNFITLNAYNGMHIATVQVDKDSKGRIGCLAFSPGMYSRILEVFKVYHFQHKFIK